MKHDGTSRNRRGTTTKLNTYIIMSYDQNKVFFLRKKNAFRAQSNVSRSTLMLCISFPFWNKIIGLRKAARLHVRSSISTTRSSYLRVPISEKNCLSHRACLHCLAFLNSNYNVSFNCGNVSGKSFVVCLIFTSRPTRISQLLYVDGAFYWVLA